MNLPTLRTQERKPWDSIQLLSEQIAVKVAFCKEILLLFKDLHDTIPLNNNHLANGEWTVL